MSSQSRALRTLCQNGFIFTQAGDKCVTRLATLGLLFQENLQGQLRRFDRQCHFPVFPVSHLGECDPLLKQRLLLQNHRSLQENHSSSQLSDCRSFAFRCNQMVSVEQNLRFLWSMKKDEDNIAEVDRQQVQRFAIYCSPDGSLNTFHWMQSQRYRLWRALSQFPSNFVLKEIRSESDQCQQMSIDFKRGDFQIPLEKLVYDRNVQEKELKEFAPQDVVICETYLDNCTIALLLDALVDKPNRSVMVLNERLVPYQVAIAVVGSTNERTTEAIDYLFSLNQHLRITVYPFLYSITSRDSNFESLDKIGVLYTIIVDDSTLDKGILHLRNRDTELMEQLHITKVQQFLPLYTKTRRPREMVANQNSIEKI